MRNQDVKRKSRWMRDRERVGCGDQLATVDEGHRGSKRRRIAGGREDKDHRGENDRP